MGGGGKGGGGGGKGGGGGVAIPEFVTKGQQRLSETGREIFDISKPGLQAGSTQATQLIATGGPGARVPVLQQAVRAQQRGTSQAMKAVGESLSRSGVSGPFANRIQGQIARQGEAAARNIPIQAALPLIQGAAGAALGGSAAGTQAASAGARALAAGLRKPQPSGAPGGGDLASGLFSLFGKGGSFPMSFGGGGGGKSAGGGGGLQGIGGGGPANTISPAF